MALFIIVIIFNDKKSVYVRANYPNSSCKCTKYLNLSLRYLSSFNKSY